MKKHWLHGLCLFLLFFGGLFLDGKVEAVEEASSQAYDFNQQKITLTLTDKVAAAESKPQAKPFGKLPNTGELSVYLATIIGGILVVAGCMIWLIRTKRRGHTK